jgi:N-carbamoyl-L-amino-acid hydrolase
MADFPSLWASLAPIGRTPGGYYRWAWSEADRAFRSWFTEQAAARGLSVETDGNGNLWAWLGDPAAGCRTPPGGGSAGVAAGAVVTGSHFDSVPGGGGYDGPLGIVCALLAVDALRERGVTPARPVGIVAFAEEEGSRFGVACLGSRLLCGDLDPARALALRDRDGVALPEAAGLDPARLGPDPKRLAGIDAFVELHIEQGRALAATAAPVGVASAIWPHGRWRLDFAGEGNHAGTTRMSDRRDPMLTFAYAVLAANKAARLRDAHATVGRLTVSPNATNAIPSTVTAWLDARAADPSTLDGLVDDVLAKVAERAGRDGTTFSATVESLSPRTSFDTGLRDRIAALLGGAPVLPTGAGHDAGVLAAHVPTAMLFVRNPTGVSHAPGEHATDEDCTAGVAALADVLAELACR